MIEKIINLKCDIICLHEVDKLDEIRAGLSKRYKLAIFKHRKVTGRDDGSAIFYDPAVFELLDVGCLRFAGPANLDAPFLTPFHEINNGVVTPELLRSDNPSSPEKVLCLCYTDDFSSKNISHYTERGVVMALLRHRDSKMDVLIAGTHLYHTQNK